jgi:hypothetical protein
VIIRCCADRAAPSIWQSPGIGALSFAAFAGCLTGLWIDEMHRSASKAGNAHEDFVGLLGFAVIPSEPLHLEARIWAAEDEWRHSGS